MGTNIDIGSTITTELELFYRDKKLATGTDFFKKWNGKFFLITNWHNVTGRNPQTLKPLCNHGGIPDRVKFKVRKLGSYADWKPIERLLYEDTDDSTPSKPVWLEHATHRNKIDVIAIPIPIPEGVTTIDEVDTARMLLRVATDVFILGYPKGISGGGEFPIWKRASIATEPDIQLDALPKMLVDTATREGMSGAPVIAVARRGVLEPEAGLIGNWDPGYRFAGVYSGRLGDSELQAQLGIVWKAQAVDEIVQDQTKGKSSFSLSIE
jgi:hypothetical protein